MAKRLEILVVPDCFKEIKMVIIKLSVVIECFVKICHFKFSSLDFIYSSLIQYIFSVIMFFHLL